MSRLALTALAIALIAAPGGGRRFTGRLGRRERIALVNGGHVALITGALA